MNSEHEKNYTLEELAALLKQARKNKEKELGEKITHLMVADAIGVGRATVTLWEQGKRSPSFLHILNYCRFLGITLDELVGLQQQQTFYLEFTEEERDAILAMITEYRGEVEKSHLHDKFHALEQYLKAFLGRARSQ